LSSLSLRGTYVEIAQDLIKRWAWDSPGCHRRYVDNVQDAIERGTLMLGCSRMLLRSMLGLFTISLRGGLKLSRINERYTKMV
jgi:hypothetical protein